MKIDLRGLHKFIEMLVRVNAAQNPPEKEESKGPIPNSYIKALSALRPSSEGKLSWVKDPVSGRITESPAEIASITKRHWENAWAERPIDSHVMDQYLASPPFTIPQDTEWVVTKDLVLEAIAESKNTSPGVDGIPFIAYRATSSLSAEIIYKVILDLLSPNPQAHPEDLNACLLFLLPKKPEGQVDGIPYYLPAQTRPISVGCCCVRIISNVLRKVMMRNIEPLISPEQRGFLHRRFIQDNIHEVLRAFAAKLPSNKSRFLLLVDFEAAFPSINQVFIWKSLRRIGVPNNWISAISKLFENVTHTLVFNRKIFPHAPVFSGIKQGDPLSPLLFVICVEALLKALKDALPSPDFARAYADDISVVFDDFVSTLPIIVNRFSVFGRASGCKVNILKTYLLSSKEWVPDEQDVLLSTEWAPMRNTPSCFPDNAIYLGILVGNDVTPTQMFDRPFNKFENRIVQWSQIPLSLTSRIMVCNIYLLSIFSYVIQFTLMPKAVAVKISSLVMRFVFRFRYVPHTVAPWLDILLGIKPVVRDIYIANISCLLKQDHLTEPEKTRLAGRICSHNHREAAIKQFRKITGSNFATLMEVADPTGVKSSSQSFIYNLIKKNAESRGSAVTRWWNERSAKWNNAPFGPVDGILAISNLQSIKNVVSSGDLLAFFRLFINSIPTKRRTRHWQNHDDLRCVFCNDEEDSIVHYIREDAHGCSAVQSAFYQMFGEDIRAKNLLLNFPYNKKHEFFHTKWGSFIQGLMKARTDIEGLPNDFNSPFALLKAKRCIIRWTQLYSGFRKKTRKKIQAKPQVHVRPMIVFHNGSYHRVVSSGEQFTLIAANGVRHNFSKPDLRRIYFKNRHKPIHVFTDGSFQKEGPGVEKAAGWSAIILGVTSRPVEIFGPVSIHEDEACNFGARQLSNEVAEIVAIIAVLIYLRSIGSPPSRQIHLHTDSKNAIRALTFSYSRKNRELVARLRSEYDMSRLSSTVQVHKILAHTNQFWNERADQFAKKGLSGEQSKNQRHAILQISEI